MVFFRPSGDPSADGGAVKITDLIGVCTGALPCVSTNYQNAFAATVPETVIDHVICL